MTLVSLASLKPGEKGVVQSIQAGWGATRRLQDLGITPGERIEVIRSAQFGGPLEIRVRGSSLSIGRGIAMRVFVQLEG
jgi:Fe2+ transport system protein FeoA